MRLAVISDIHGNKVALDAVLAEIAAQQIEHIVCLGDVAALGPQPREVLERLKVLSCPVVMGNTDDWLLQPQLKEQTDLDRQRMQDIELWCAQQLSAPDQEYVSTFQPTITYPLADGKTLLAYHGSPRSYNEIIVTTTPEEALEQAFAGFHADVMVGGHTHIQMFRRYKDGIVLNPGSVGLAIDRVSPLSEARNPPWAEYAILALEDGRFHIELHRTPFNLQEFIQTILRSGVPHAAWLAGEWGNS
jgi:predicted phosphodiesterase